MSGRVGMFPGVGNFPFEIWDAWYGPYSAGPAVPPTFLGNNMTIGTIVSSIDPYWGSAEFLLCQFQTPSTALAVGTLVNWDNNYIISAVPNTGLTGRPCGVLATQFLSDSTLGALTAPWNQVQTTNQLYGWVQISGLGPVLGTAALTAGPAYIGATVGQLTSTNPTGGKQVNNLNVIVATATAWSRYGATTIVNASTITGRSEIFLNDKTGLFPGIGISGTNIPANSYIADMQTGRNNSVLLNAAATGSGPTTITPAYTYSTTYIALAQFDRPFMQGSIT